MLNIRIEIIFNSLFFQKVLVQQLKHKQYYSKSINMPFSLNLLQSKHSHIFPQLCTALFNLGSHVIDYFKVFRSKDDWKPPAALKLGFDRLSCLAQLTY